jgi:hypothetical protein
MKKWLAGIAATVIAGVLIYWLTEGLQQIKTVQQNGNGKQQQDENGPPPDCKEWRHLLDVKQQQLNMARQDLDHIRKAASAGDPPAKRVLPQREQLVQQLEREAGDLREKIHTFCDGR